MSALYGLVLAGGRSSRMRADKAALAYGGVPQLEAAWRLLAGRTARAFVSVRADQAENPLRARYPQIVDGALGSGPIAGILAAQAAEPGAAWLVLACDLPRLDGSTLDALIAARDPGRLATAYRAAGGGPPEPLCAIWEPASHAPLVAFVEAGGHCPRKFLATHDARLLDLARPGALDNANTPDEAESLRRALAAGGA